LVPEPELGPNFHIPAEPACHPTRTWFVAPVIASLPNQGFVVSIPTLPLETEIGELPTAEVPVNTGTVPVVPEPVTCAAAPTAIEAKTNKNKAVRLTIAPIPFFLNRLRALCCLAQE
jgi:hypothetical protein